MKIKIKTMKRFFWQKEEKRELTTLEMFKLVNFTKDVIDSRAKMGMGFPMELGTTLNAYAIGERIPYYGSDTYCKVLDLHRIMENLKK